MTGFHKPGVYRSGRVAANAWWELFVSSRLEVAVVPTMLCFGGFAAVCFESQGDSHILFLSTFFEDTRPAASTSPTCLNRRSTSKLFALLRPSTCLDLCWGWVGSTSPLLDFSIRVAIVCVARVCSGGVIDKIRLIAGKGRACSCHVWP